MQLMILNNVSSTCIAMLGKGENVTTDVLLRISIVLNCDISNIVECVEETLDEQ